MRPPEHSILWRRLDLPGHDYCGVWKIADGWRLSGTSLFLLSGRPCRLAYEVSTDHAWRASMARVSGELGESAIDIEIVRTNGRWSLDGADAPETADCTDVDLGFTPATNLIALRRLDLGIGEPAQAPAAWLDFPEGKLIRLEQRYRRVSPHEYEYESPAAGYAAVLETDSQGAVVRYPGLWEREAG
jgi:uncharacterized protein